MRLAVKSRADRTFFYTVITNVDSGVEHWDYTQRWASTDRKATTDLQRKYLTAILSLERTRLFDAGEITLYVESKMIDKQLRGVSDTSTIEIATLKSELIGLMTRLGATFGGTH